MLDEFATHADLLTIFSRCSLRNIARRLFVALRAVEAIVCFFGLLLTTAYAQITALPGSGSLILRGKAGEDITARVELISPDAVTGLMFRSEDLRSDGGEIISRQQIAPSASDFNLAANTPKYFDIKITGVKSCGRFKGNFFFLQPGKGSAAAVTIPVEVNVDPVAKLAIRKGSETLKLQLVDCYGWGCYIARWLEPRAFLSKYPVLLDDASVGAPAITVAVAAIGDVTHTSLTGVLSGKSPANAGSGPIFEYAVDVNANGNSPLLPDHYLGDLQVQSGSQTVVRVPIDVNVREGPGIPLLVLVCGILLGRLIKYMKDKGGPQSDLLLRIYGLEGRLAASPEDQRLLQPMVEGVKQEIYDMQLDQAKADLSAIESRWTLLGTLRGLDQTLTPRAGDQGVQDILSQIRAARGLIELKRDQDAATAVAQIENAIAALSNQTGGPSPALTLAVAQAGTARTVATRAANVAAAKQEHSRFVRFLSGLTGISMELRAQVSLWVLRPTGYLLLIAALAAVGMQQLYLKNATFGADAFSDYFGLLIWAMSADVASRTLSCLRQ